MTCNRFVAHEVKNYVKKRRAFSNVINTFIYFYYLHYFMCVLFPMIEEEEKKVMSWYLLNLYNDKK